MRVTNKADVPIVGALGALGASAVAQPVNVINQNLTNGVIDAIAVGPSAIRSFKLQEPANHITTWFPGSGSAFVLLLNNDVYNGLSEEVRGWVDAAADEALSLSGGAFCDKAATDGMALAAEEGVEEGVEVIDISDAEKARWLETIGPTLDAAMTEQAGDMTIGEVMALMRGDGS